MATTNEEAVNALSHLYRILEAGERGFATAAANANTRELKILFKSYALQRAKFKSEVEDALRQLGRDSMPRPSLLGAIHRGRVAIFAGMTIEEEGRRRVILKEAAFGERYAVQAYQRTLGAELPPETRALIERQFEDVRKVVEQIHLMQGKDGKALVIKLFDSEKEAEKAEQSLVEAGFAKEDIEKVALNNSFELYDGQGTTIPETILSGAFGGVIWATLIGILAGLGAVQSSFQEVLGITSAVGVFFLVLFATIILGAIGGGIIGLAIGSALHEEDTHIYQQSFLQGRYLVSGVADTDSAVQAGQMLDQIKASA